MTTFPAVEAYRAELQRMGYEPLDDAELAEARTRYAAAHHSSGIEGIHPNAEQAAFWQMLFEERAPREVRQRMADRFLHERIVAPAFARQAAAAAAAPA